MARVAGRQPPLPPGPKDENREKRAGQGKQKVRSASGAMAGTRWALTTSVGFRKGRNEGGGAEHLCLGMSTCGLPGPVTLR